MKKTKIRNHEAQSGFFYLGQVNQLYIFRNEYKSCTSLQELQLEAFPVKQCDSDVLTSVCGNLSFICVVITVGLRWNKFWLCVLNLH